MKREGEKNLIYKQFGGKKKKPLTRNINFQLATDYILTGVCIWFQSGFDLTNLV